MSDHEFNNYLTLLAGLLRLGDKQRRAIAEELRTHLEDRLEELLARGVSREEAVQRALAEFGDAAGLAAQFASISRGRRRRWLMRVTTFSVAATVLIAAGIVTFWPGRNAGPGQAEAVAQAPAVGADGAPPNRPTAAERPLEAKLNQRIDVEFVETPLKDAIAFLSDQTGIQFVIRKKTLEDAGLTPDATVTISLKQVRLNTILELMLRDLDLVHTEKDDLLIITTPDDAESTLEIRVYDCRDLLAMPEPGSETKRSSSRPGAQSNGGGSYATPVTVVETQAQSPRTPSPVQPVVESFPPPAIPRIPSPQPRIPTVTPPASAAPRVPSDIMPQFAQPTDILAQGGFGGGVGGGESTSPKPLSEHEQRAQRLIDLVTTSVDPQSWADVGGPGSISEYHGLIVVAQTAPIHKKVEHVLNMLRQAADLTAPQGRVVR